MVAIKLVFAVVVSAIVKAFLYAMHDESAYAFHFQFCVNEAHALAYGA